jgi:hypothetical protein
MRGKITAEGETHNVVFLYETNEEDKTGCFEFELILEKDKAYIEQLVKTGKLVIETPEGNKEFSLSSAQFQPPTEDDEVRLKFYVYNENLKKIT